MGGYLLFEGFFNILIICLVYNRGFIMKKLLLAGVLSLALPISAEVVSAVSYNPSRMGDYVYLKVADKANLKGGIESNTMTVRSGGTVSASSPNLNYDVPAVVGASGSTLDMPNTAIHGSNANTYNGYQSVNSGTPRALLNNVYVNGGQTTIKNDSYISTLNAVNRLKQKAATLRANKLSVSGSEDASLYDGATTDGFTLAGNDIPQPTSSHVNTGSSLSNCTLKWEDRVTSDNQKVKLLALTNCGGGSSSGDSGSEKCIWEYRNQLSSCTMNHKIYCSVAGDWPSILSASSCSGAVLSLDKCPEPTPGAVCLVREQHTYPIDCNPEKMNSYTDTITACQARTYRAKCTVSKF